MIENSSLIKTAEDFIDKKDWGAASDAYALLARSYPNEPDVHYLHGRVLMELTQWDAALTRFDMAVTIGDKESRFHRSRGDALQAMGKLLDAENAYRRAIDLNPQDTDAMINLGNTMNKQERPNAALSWYGRALAFDSENLLALNNIGKTWHDLGELQQAKIWYEKALSRNPNYAEARFNRALALLTEGDYIHGWMEYEWRFRRRSAKRVYPHRLEGERWDGKSFRDRRLLVHCEQGMGDVIQFCRYMPMVKALGGKVILEVHPPLVSLLQGMPSIDRVIPFDRGQRPTVDYDIYIPLMSLPLLFGTTIDNIPCQTPYLKPSTVEISRWQYRPGTHHTPSIGLVWAGSNIDPRRSCPWDIVAELTEAMNNIHFFSLQKELPSEVNRDLLNRAHIIHWGDFLNDFHATAAAISHLDMIISVDTATAHLVGAMGKPLWVLLPYTADWRWFQDRLDVPWYPTARLFRQPKNGNWRSLLVSLIGALETWCPSQSI